MRSGWWKKSKESINVEGGFFCGGQNFSKSVSVGPTFIREMKVLTLHCTKKQVQPECQVLNSTNIYQSTYEFVQVGDFGKNSYQLKLDSTSMNFPQQDFFQVPKIVLSGDPVYEKIQQYIVCEFGTFIKRKKTFSFKYGNGSSSLQNTKVFHFINDIAKHYMQKMQVFLLLN